MLAELKDKSQVTIPKPIVQELCLSKGDLFDVVVHDGIINLVPVVVYPKDVAAKLEKLAECARKTSDSVESPVYDDPEDLIADLHKAV
ncbi:AbrB/MazE/SpoVT family DNA-binding domain-containing protein [Slackia exigua]|uniref:AbrB/MazE/SpoVT family DNA-binding domain-containing protein n=1 Tax=Slackia exigua TaxID=84109 RepID=UPI0028DB5AB7|nr:AbrB/MazE/SpoVT family DNA-binding domain-containing protein [Slackia exigua]